VPTPDAGAGAARLRIVVAAVLFSTGGAAIKLCGLTGWQVAGFRGLVAGVAILVMIPEARRSFSWRAALVGVAYGATTVLFALANKLTTAAAAIFLQSTSPVFILALAPWLLKEHASRRDLALMGIATGAMALLFVGAGGPTATARDPLLGNVLATGSALTWAVNLIGYRLLVRGRGPRGGEGAVAAAAASGNFFSFIVALPFAFPVAHSHPADWAVLVYLGVFQLGLAYAFMSRALSHVSALEVSLIVMIEPVLSPIWAWLVQGEVPGVWSLVGGAIMLAALGAKARLDARGPASPVPVLAD